MTTLPCSFDLTGPYVYDLNVQVLWTTSIMDVQAPTDVEVAAATLLNDTYDLTDIIGWEAETNIISDGEWGPWEEQRLGRQKVPTEALMFAAHRDGNDIRTLLTRGDLGWILILPSGPYLLHPTAPINVFPVRVAQLTQRQRLRDGGSSLILVNFAARGRVGENVTVVGP